MTEPYKIQKVDGNWGIFDVLHEKMLCTFINQFIAEATVKDLNDAWKSGYDAGKDEEYKAWDECWRGAW